MKKILSVLLALCLLVGGVPLSAGADETATTGPKLGRINETAYVGDTEVAFQIHSFSGDFSENATTTENWVFGYGNTGLSDPQIKFPSNGSMDKSNVLISFTAPGDGVREGDLTITAKQTAFADATSDSQPLTIKISEGFEEIESMELIKNENGTPTGLTWTVTRKNEKRWWPNFTKICLGETSGSSVESKKLEDIDKSKLKVTPELKDGKPESDTMYTYTYTLTTDLNTLKPGKYDLSIECTNGKTGEDEVSQTTSQGNCSWTVADETHEHSWDAGEVKTPATLDTDGVKTFTCTVCGQTKTEGVKIPWDGELAFEQDLGSAPSMADWSVISSLLGNVNIPRDQSSFELKGELLKDNEPCDSLDVKVGLAKGYGGDEQPVWDTGETPDESSQWTLYLGSKTQEVIPPGIYKVTLIMKSFRYKDTEMTVSLKYSTKPPVVNPDPGPTTPTTPSTPTPKDEVTPTPTVSGGTASTTVSSSDGASLVEAAKQPSTSEVTVKVDTTQDVTAANVTLPASTVNGVGAAKADLKVETPVADITLPSAALTNLSTGAGSVTVSTAVNSDKTVSIDVKKDNTVVKTLAEPLRASIPDKSVTGSTVAVLVDENGKETIIPKSISGKDEMNLLLSGSGKIKLKDNAKTFNDTQGHWADNDGSIGFATSRELFQGTGDGAFSPDTTMTRGMIVTVLHRLESKPKGGSVSFGDVSADAYFAEAVAWGNENDIVKGDGSNFQPDDNVTREQLATFLYRYAGKYGVDTAGRTNLTSFPDSGNVSGYAKDALEWAYHTGLIKGGSDGKLNPTGSARRGEVAAILMRFVEYINK